MSLKETNFKTKKLRAELYKVTKIDKSRKILKVTNIEKIFYQ